MVKHRREWQQCHSTRFTTAANTFSTKLVNHMNLFSKSIPSIHIRLRCIRLRHREPGLLGNRVRDWAVTSLSPEQFFALGKVYSCLHRRPSFWVGLGSRVWGGLAGSRLQVDFGTCDREGLKNEKKWRECGKKELNSKEKKSRGSWEMADVGLAGP